MRTHESREDYLERILMLQEKGLTEIRAIDIATSLGYSRPSVSVALKKLLEEGFIEYGPRQQIHLTEAGRAIAEKIYERHKIISGFFVAMGVDPETAAEDACRIEHDLSDASFEALKRIAEERTRQG